MNFISRDKQHQYMTNSFKNHQENLVSQDIELSNNIINQYL